MQEIKFDIRDVKKENPKLQGKTPSDMYRTDHKIPRKYKVKKRWWEK